MECFVVVFEEFGKGVWVFRGGGVGVIFYRYFFYFGGSYVIVYRRVIRLRVVYGGGVRVGGGVVGGV